MVHLPAQHNLQDAADLAAEALRAQSADRFRWLGARRDGDGWRLRVLGSDLRVEPAPGEVYGPEGGKVGPFWRVLVLHYLAVGGRPQPMPPEVAFADLGAARTYAGVYAKRVNERLCAVAGRGGVIGPDGSPGRSPADALRAAAAALDAKPVQAGDVAFDLTPMPRVAVRVIWYAADSEFPASATVLFPGNIEAFFCLEDIVVLSERIVSRLSGRSF